MKNPFSTQSTLNSGIEGDDARDEADGFCQAKITPQGLDFLAQQ
jgi:hypothetical protein